MSNHDNKGRFTKGHKAGLTAIYVLKDQDGAVRYVGKTISPAKRLEGHTFPGKRAIYPVSRWVMELRSAGHRPVMDIIEWTDDWEKRERHWIAFYRAAGADLLNIEPGGTTRVKRSETPTGLLRTYRRVLYSCDRIGNTAAGDAIRARMEQEKLRGPEFARAFDRDLQDTLDARLVAKCRQALIDDPSDDTLHTIRFIISKYPALFDGLHA
ncbi:GIY-YIG nuclease family protein [Mesorhizobium sp. M0028]|uniref:GIY-YIG nuclease family protein n=1 Tax=Mesorhizobium sp. M0028 TaxID=2956849 RepID=UPI00333C957A